ncbi:hypothetical protein ABT390_34290 [Streptomyces aurantiacus]|uniref:Uncharacterized protein n=1 Tax=Streptomyces aurantiacus JA 4570 TaxID=1286094 RepID=S3ZFR4_9ACTN|nr:hypothetical protein [Streptomyces aurantiacus]EPH41479.1 hypothetical protein STRAU_5483 [Streptomyces aurantiacus JA 4570]
MTGVFDDDHNDEGPGKGLLSSGLGAVLQNATVVVKAPVGTALDTIPAPRPPVGDGPLTAEEREALDACKAGLNNLHNAFWIAGKSLETMQTGNLHRNEGIGSFAEYVWINWEISESQMHRLIGEWRIGEQLAQLGHRPRESQVRELADIKQAAGDRAAVAVYDAVVRAGQRVTARLLKDVSRQLPPLTADLSPAEIGKLVHQVLSPPPPGPETAGATDSDTSRATPGEQQDSTVPNITSLGENSPIGESGPQPSNPNGPDGAKDLRMLNAALTELKQVDRSISKPAVRRVLEFDADRATALLTEIDATLNRIGRSIAVRRTDQ